MQKVIGIDYGLTSPAVSILEDQSFENSTHYFLTDTKKYIGTFGNVVGREHKPYVNSQQRYENITYWVLEVTEMIIRKPDLIVIEDYSLGSSGKTFDLAENCGLLKYFLYFLSMPYIVVSPATNKKFFSGKGNATKDVMYDAFVNQTQDDLRRRLYMSGKLASPITDIVDSFALGVYGLDYIRKQKSSTNQ